MNYPKHTQGSECEGCNERLKDGHILIQSFFHQIKDKYPDVHTSCVHRGKEEQEEAFRNGFSHAHFGQSKHNLMPSEAVDLFQINEKGVPHWDPVFMAHIHSESAKLGFDLTWGGTFKKLKDTPHFELKGS